MTKITAPYSFVPLNKDVYLPEWGNLISHDIPFEDGEDGVATVRIKNLSPLFIKSAKEGDKESVHVIVDGKKKYFIPGSSIKGMLRSTLEIMSFGKMLQFNDDFFGFRYFHTKIDPSANYAAKMNDGTGEDAKYSGKCGYLMKDYEDNYYIEDCGAPESIKIEELKVLESRYKGSNDNAFAMNDKLRYPTVKGKTLVCTGKGISGPTEKKNEMLFGEVIGEKQVSKEVIHKFLGAYRTSIYEDRTHLNKDVKTISERLNSADSGHNGAIGNRLPVFYHEDEDGNVISLGITKMYRYPSKYSVKDLVKQKEYNRNMLDLPECIFGKVASDNNPLSLKGRVTIGNAFARTSVSEKEEISGVFGSPSASFFPLYLAQNTMSKMKTYNSEDSEIAGRKMYRVRPDGGYVLPPQGNGSEKVMTHLTPLNPGTIFEFKIVFHNMKPVEIGAILSSLTFNNTSSCHHSIGYGKAIGMGKITIESINLHGLKKDDPLEYMHDFEKEMLAFTKSTLKQLWNETDQIRKLAGISFNHVNEEDLRYMDLKSYGEAKINEVTAKGIKHVVVQDPPVVLSSLLKPEDTQMRTFKTKNAADYKFITSFESFTNTEECKKAEEVITYLLDKLKTSNDDFDYKHECELELTAFKTKISQKKAEILNRESNVDKFAGKLSDCINASMKPNTIIGNFKKWLERRGGTASEEDKKYLLSVLSEIVDRMKPKDKKDFGKRPKWNQLNDILGSEAVDSWFNETFCG